METVNQIIGQISNIVWGPYMLALLVGVGIFLTIGLKAMTWRQLPTAFRLLWQGRHGDVSRGDVPPFQALMTAMAATVGTGNIAGVATAIFVGGPGAVFWMWITALFGMATKYAEAVLAVHFREIDHRGMRVGGPMYYIKNGLGEHWRWLGFLFALFGMLAGFGIGNMVQSNSVADALHSHFALSHELTGLIITVAAAAVILGGIKRIARTAAVLVPFMALAYIAGSLLIIFLNIGAVPDALASIVHDAFTGTAAAGGFAGSTVWIAIRMGVARGVFSNEAGLGSAPIAHAAAQTDNPVRQGTIAMLGTFIDTLIICTMTALVIILTGVWNSGENGAALSALAFNNGLQGFGGYIVAFGLAIFAFSTILGWSYYSERCAEFIFGEKIILPFRLLWIAAIPLGALAELETVWDIADVLNGLMAVPNLIALILLSPLVFRFNFNL